MKIKINFDAALSMLSPDHRLVKLEAAISNRDVYKGSGTVFSIAFVGITEHLVHNSKKEDFKYFTYFN